MKEHLTMAEQLNQKYSQQLKAFEKIKYVCLSVCLSTLTLSDQMCFRKSLEKFAEKQEKSWENLLEWMDKTMKYNEKLLLLDAFHVRN